MKIFFHSIDAAGHVGACIGLAQALARRGHRIIFVIDESYAGGITKYGFEEILLRKSGSDSDHHKQDCHKTKHHAHNHVDMILKLGLLDNKTPLEKAETVSGIVMNDEILKKFIEYEPQFAEAIEREKPDLIIADICRFVLWPCIYNGKVPYALIHSSNPLSVYNSPDLPPPGSGYPTNDRTHWNSFDSVRERARKHLEERWNKLMKHFNYPEVKLDSDVILSPFLNIYAYPEELDYTDIVPVPGHLFRIDAFARVAPEPFEFPPEFRCKIKPGDKVVYVSLGSTGSANVDVMKKIVAVLADTPHKYVVSKGAKHEEYQLAENMWGDVFLPQVAILPLVDLVITHGGNNTLTETFHAGKLMIVMPLFADQYDNAQRIQEKGLGLRIDPFNFQAQQLVAAINQMLGDEMIREKMTKASTRITQSDRRDLLCQQLESLSKTK